jgi:hypothetical protein
MLDYIYSSQLTLIGTNRHSTQNVVIHDLKIRYVLGSTVKYTVCSLKSNSDLIIFTHGRGRARLYIYIYSSNLTVIGSNPQAIKYVFIRGLKMRYTLRSRVKFIL